MLIAYIGFCSFFGFFVKKFFWVLKAFRICVLQIHRKIGITESVNSKVNSLLFQVHECLNLFSMNIRMLNKVFKNLLVDCLLCELLLIELKYCSCEVIVRNCCRLLCCYSCLWLLVCSLLRDTLCSCFLLRSSILLCIYSYIFLCSCSSLLRSSICLWLRSSLLSCCFCYWFRFLFQAVRQELS